MSEKILCDNCMYFDWNGKSFKGNLPNRCKCTHPDNIKTEMETTFWKDVEKKTYVGEPKDINVNNNCDWFAENKDVAVKVEPHEGQI